MPAPAAAGAWIAPEGGQEIVASAAGQRDELYFYEGATYWEAPFDPSMSAAASTWLEQNHDIVDGWRGEGVIGVSALSFAMRIR